MDPKDPPAKPEPDERPSLFDDFLLAGDEVRAEREREAAELRRRLLEGPAPPPPKRKLEPSPKRFSATGHAAPIDLPDIVLGTSAFTADGWEGTFYPPGMKSAEFLPFYADRFQTVEVDSTFYRTPAAATVRGWYQKTPPDFIFAAKVPRVITHDKVLVDCDAEWNVFLDAMELLDEKLGPILFQFGYFNKSAFQGVEEFLARLKPFLKKLPRDRKFVVEIRNKNWLDARLTDALRERNVALALLDQAWMPRPWEMNRPTETSLPAGRQAPAPTAKKTAPRKKKFDPITSNFVYVRWLGDRKGIEEVTTTWNKTVVDRRADLANWVKVFQKFVARNLRVFAYANNHYAGYGPGTLQLFRELWEKKK
jgi:uncharacterized protein YecE (DUF72 family)